MGFAEASDSSTESIMKSETPKEAVELGEVNFEPEDDDAGFDFNFLLTFSTLAIEDISNKANLL